MAFLSGVLDAVKDDDAVKTYDNYVLETNKLEKVLDTLNNKIGTGRNGLVDAVAEVKRWLVQYWTEVQNKNSKITMPIYELEKQIETKKVELAEFLNVKYEVKESELATWVKDVEELPKKSKESYEALSHLDGNLKNKLQPHVDVINRFSESFKKTSYNDFVGLVHVCGKVDEQVKTITEYANVRIREAQVEVGQMLSKAAWNLNECGKKSSILDKECETASQQLQSLKESGTEFFSKAQMISENVDQLNTHIRDVLDPLINRITEAAGVAMDRLFIEHIQRELQKLAQQVNEKIKVLGNKFNVSEGRDGRTKVFEIVSELRTKIDGIMGTNGLKGVLNGVTTYVSAFTGGQFGPTVQHWIKDILDNNAVVNDWLSWHIRDNQSKSNLKPEYHTDNVKAIYMNKTEAIARLIMRELTKQVHINFTDAIISADASGKYQSILDAVYLCISNLIKQLDVKLKTAAIDSIAKEVATQVENEGTLGITNSASTQNAKSYLEEALRMTLVTLHSKCRQAAKELHSFALENRVGGKASISQTLDSVFADTSKLVLQLESATDPERTSRAHSQSPAQAVDVAIKNVNTEVNENLVNKFTGQVKTQLDSAVSAVKPIFDSVKDFSAALSKNGTHSVAKDVKLLHEHNACIQDEFQNLIAAVRNANLTNTIKEIRIALIEARNKVINHIKQLAGQFTERAINAQIAIKKEALSQFVNFKLTVLSDLKQLITKQNQIISDIIGDYLSNGVKGLLRWMRGGERQGFDNTFSSLAAFVKTFPGTTDDLKSLSPLCGAFKDHIDKILDYVEYQLTATKTSKEVNEKSKINGLKDKLENLLNHLIGNCNRIHNFDHQFTQLLSTLSSSLSALSPSAFANPRHPELLDAVKKGLQGFVDEMGRVYVNGYDGRFIKWFDNDAREEKLTVSGKNCAKVFFSFLPLLLEDLNELKERCAEGGSCRANKIHLKEANGKKNKLGEFFDRCGYKVSKEKQDGEVRNSDVCKGEHIYGKLVGETENVFLSDKNGKRALELLYDYLDKYNEVCHLSTLYSKRQPCSVFEMLVWLSGLTHNPVHSSKLGLSVMQMLEDLKKKGEKEKDDESDLADDGDADLDVSQKGDDLKVSLLKSDDVSLEVYPHKISYDDIWQSVTDTCANAYDVLCTIAGTGDEFTIYAADYSNNSMQLHYPQSGEDCFEMLSDIFRRLLPSLRFMYTQCGVSSKHHGWQNCKYGKDIRTGKWPCKEHPNELPNDQPIEEPNDEPNDQSNCQPTSPLMSYLNDCLPGHLPHQLTKIGCKYECANCPSVSKKGMPCLTPLGFKGFSNSPKTGKAICEVLTKFFSKDLTWSLFCLSPRPPKTLPEHFGFALSLVSGWLQGSASKRNFNNDSSLQHSFESCIRDQSIKLYSDPAELTKALTQAYGSQSVLHASCEHPHLVNMVTTDICRKHPCSPYMYTLCMDVNTYLPQKQVDLYLSWTVYLPWQFWQLLKTFYDSFCSISCQDWGCRGCLRGDKCKKGEHGVTSDDERNAICQCPSIVQCKGVSPTLYQYGFSFGDSAALNSERYPKSCSNFCQLLDKMLQSNYFTELFNKCDDFLFKIRAPFIWLNVALWLLSFLYLLHIMVIRLDLLHIKSHLHSPSSHRIAALSLLAAGRVNKLNRVFYLQP